MIFLWQVAAALAYGGAWRVRGSVFEKVVAEAVFVGMLDRSIATDCACSTVAGLDLKRQAVKGGCVVFEGCRFVQCRASGSGGACKIESADVRFAGCAFWKCSATYGGAVWASGAKGFDVNQTAFAETSAERFGAVYLDCDKRETKGVFSSSNVSLASSTKFIAGIRVEGCCPAFKYVRISDTYAPRFGAVWDWSARPNVAVYEHCAFSNNTSGSEGAAVTVYHWMHQSVIDDCLFQMGRGAHPVYVYLHSSEAVVDVRNCRFDCDVARAIGGRFANRIVIDKSCQFA